MSLGSVMSGRSAASDALALGEAEVDESASVSAPAILSLSLELSSPLPQADSDRAATAASAMAVSGEWGGGSRMAPRWGEGSHECANAIGWDLGDNSRLYVNPDCLSR